MSIMEGKRDVLAECKAKLETTLKVKNARYCLLLPDLYCCQTSRINCLHIYQYICVDILSLMSSDDSI